MVVTPTTALRMEEHQREQVAEHGGHTQPNAEDVGAPLRGGQ
jgi:hypothetical protein